jgi:ketosteroid isomerase-like protein
VQQGFEAFNRQDFQAAFMLWHRDVECVFPSQFVALGFEPAYRGRVARLDVQRRWNSEWGDWRFEPAEVVDLADGRMLILGRGKGSGLRSGAAVADEVAFLVTLDAGQVVREEIFLGHQGALEAVGLR